MLLNWQNNPCSLDPSTEVTCSRTECLSNSTGHLRQHFRLIPGQDRRSKVTRKSDGNMPLDHSLIPPPSILQLGRGPGVPVLQTLLDHEAIVTGNDFSTRQLRLANKKFLEAKLIIRVMSSPSFPSRTFDGVVYSYAVFLPPRAE